MPLRLFTFNLPTAPNGVNIFDIQRFAGSSPFTAISDLLDGIGNVANESKVIEGVGTFRDVANSVATTFDLIKDIGEAFKNREFDTVFELTRKLSSAIDSLQTLVNFIKKADDAIPVFSLVASMSKLSTSINDIKKDANGKISQDKFDEAFTSSIDFLGEAVKTLLFFIPGGFASKTLELTIIPIVIDVFTSGVKTSYLVSMGSSDNAAATFSDEFLASSNLVSTVVSFFKKDAPSLEYTSDGLIKITNDDGSFILISDTPNKKYELSNENIRLSNYAYGVTISGGNGNDTIYSNPNSDENATSKGNSIIGGSGNDFIVIEEDNSTIHGNTGVDRLVAMGKKNKIYGDAGDDIIYLEEGANNNSIKGGVGDDLIIIENTKNILIEYAEGDGNDIIVGYDESDTIKIDGEYNVTTKDNDFIISVGIEKITVIEAAGKGVRINDRVLVIGETQESGISFPVFPSVWYENVKVLRGTNLNDKIENTVSNVIVEALVGNDSVKNYGTNVTINGGIGNDSIWNEEIGNLVVINGNTGNDTIRNWGDKVSIKGGEGNDDIGNYSVSSATIDAGDGNDYISNDGDSVKIDVGAGNDSIRNWFGDSLTIEGGEGDDYIDNFSGFSIKITGNLGDDSIYNSGKNSTIEGGAGDDSIFNYRCSSVTIDGGAGNDHIDNRYGNLVTINGGIGNDSIENSIGSSLKIEGGEGEDLIFSVGDSVTIEGGLGNDLVFNTGDSVKIDTGTGDDSIYNYESFSVTINSGDGNDSIYNSGNNITIGGGNGNDSIWNASGDSVIIEGGEGNDTVRNEGDSVKIDSGDFNDSIDNSGDYISISSGNGNDFIYNGGYYTTIDGGDGNDSIYNDNGDSVKINTGSGNDYVRNRGSSVTIDGSTGDDLIDSAGYNVSINGGIENDSIYNEYGEITIEGGTGNDLISLSGYTYNTKVNYVNGNGNDTIYALNYDDTLEISGTKYSTVKSGNDLIISVGTGKIKVVDGANSSFTILGTLSGGGDTTPADTLPVGISISNSILTASSSFTGNKINLADYNATSINATAVSQAVSILGNAANNSLRGGISDDTISGGIGNDTLTGSNGADIFIYESGNDIITDYTANEDKIKFASGTITSASISGSDVILNTDNGSITIKNGKNKNISVIDSTGKETSQIYPVEQSKTLNGTPNDDNLQNTVSGCTINGISGNNSITNSGASVEIYGGTGNDKISNYADKVSIFGGAGSDTIYNSGYLGGNNALINSGEGDDSIHLEYSEYATVSTGSGNDTIKGYFYYSVVDSGDGNDYIYEGNQSFSGYYEFVTINAGAGNDTIINYLEHSKIDGGTGNDLISLGSFATSSGTIIGGKGNDTIYGSTNGYGFLYQYANGDGNDIIYGVKANDTLQISGAKYSTIKSGSDLKVNVGNGSILLKNAANIAVKIVGTIESGSTTNETLQAGMSLKSSVLTASTAFKGNIINLADYEVTKVNASALSQNVTIIGSSAANSVKGGKGADIISGINGKNTISGGSGNDSILGGSDSDKLLGETGNDTLNGGTGNDTLTGGAGNDVFIYSSGNDLITDYKAGEDKIKTGTITNSTVKGSDVILTTGNGNLTIKGAKDKVVTLVDNSGNNSDKIFFNDSSYTPLETGLSYDTKRTILTAASKFSGNAIDLKNYLGTVSKVNASALTKGISIIGNSAVNNSIKGGRGADTISGNSGKDTISGGTGNDSIFGGTDNDKLLGEAGNDTLNGGTGNDTLTGGAGQDVFIYSGGNDIITDYKTGEDKIKLNPSAITNSTVKGSDIVLTTNNGTLTVKGAKDKVITFVGDNGSTTEKIFFANVSYSPLETGLTYDAKRTVLSASNKYTGITIDLSEYLGTVTKINATAPSQTLNIIGNSSANSIKAGKGADTINGGSGKDTIFGGNGNDSILGGSDSDKLLGDAGNDTLNGGTGNDMLTGGAGNDIFVYEGGSDSITDYKSGEDKIKLSPSSITSSTVKGSDVILTTSNGTLTVKATKDKVITFVGNNGRETNKIFFANTSYEPLATGLTYDAKRTVLTSSNKFTGSTIDLGEYLGTVTKINASANSQPLNIIGNSSANSIKGGKGADTISGGKGNDTLTGGGGSDVFVYQGGNDIITDYTAGQDSIKVSGSISNVSYNGKNVIFSIGTGSLTVTNAKGKDIAVSDSSNKTQTYSRTLEILYDNNFMTDEFGLDEITEVTETNYSIGKMEYSSNNNDFIINSVAADSSFDKK